MKALFAQDLRSENSNKLFSFPQKGEERSLENVVQGYS